MERDDVFHDLPHDITDIEKEMMRQSAELIPVSVGYPSTVSKKNTKTLLPTPEPVRLPDPQSLRHSVLPSPQNDSTSFTAVAGGGHDIMNPLNRGGASRAVPFGANNGLQPKLPNPDHLGANAVCRK